MLALLAPILAAPQAEQVPELVQFYRERVVPGAEAEYSRVEEEIARACARLKCPHPYLALQPVTGAPEVWWLTAFASQADRDRVVQAYERDAAVKQALQELGQRKKGLTSDGKESIASRRSQLCDAVAWRMHGVRFVVIETSKADPKGNGCVFQAPDGTRFALQTAASRGDADRLAGADSRVFEVRPAWSHPAADWIAADPSFWKAGPEPPKPASFQTKDGGIVHADEYGTGERGVVLAHGGRFTKESWQRQAAALVDAGFRVVAIDFRGRGRSRGPATDPNGDAVHHDVLAAVAYLRRNGAKQVAVVGASFGGIAAAEASAEAPGEIDRLVLLAHGPIDHPERVTGRKLFILARDDANDAGPRLPRIRDQYERSSEPKQWVVLDGSAHAQFLFETDQGDRLMKEILRFLTAP